VSTSFFRCLTALALLGAGSVLYADTCTFAGPLVVGSANVETCDTGSLSAPPNSFSLTQFNPDLGTLQDPNAVVFNFSVFDISGDGSITTDPSVCAPFYPPGCIAPAWAVDASVSANGPSGITATVGNSDDDPYVSSTDFFGEPPGSDTIPVTWSMDYITNMISPDQLDFSAAQAGPWTGAGALTFNLAGNAENATFFGAPIGAPLDFVSVTGFTYDANVQYSFVYDPTPEPSFFLVTGALFGLIAVRKVVGRQN
jgi:hypothetical protein